MSETVVTSIKNSQEIDVLHWFKQNKITLERMLGTNVTTVTLTYSDADGYGLSYTKAPAAPATTLTPPATPAV